MGWKQQKKAEILGHANFEKKVEISWEEELSNLWGQQSDNPIQDGWE